MLAERLPGILPPLTRQESLEVTAVHSVAGILPPGEPLVRRAPYCAPHHSATMQSLVGGGNGLPRPGAVSVRPPRSPLPGRSPRIRGQSPGRAAPAPRIGARRHRAQRRRHPAPRPLPDDPRRQPVPLRTAHPARSGLRMPRRHDPPLPGPAALRPPPGPRRPARRSRARTPRRPLLAEAGGASRAPSWPSVSAPPANGPRPASSGTPWQQQQRSPGPRTAHPLARRAPARSPAPNATWSAACSPHAASTASCASPGPSPTSPADDRPDAGHVALALELRTGISRGAPMPTGSTP